MKTTDELVIRLGDILTPQKLNLVTLESCTGGALAAAITKISGASGWFERGLVVYSDAAKIELAGVASATIKKHGAVSLQVAAELAHGGRRWGDCCIATTGVAGPDGGSDAKPVGTVCFGLAVGEKIKSAQQKFSGCREEIILSSVEFGLRELIKLIEK